MSFIDIVKERYSVRSYADRKVEKEKLLQVLEAGRLAPTAVNYQPFHFIVLTEEAEKQKACEVYQRSWIKDAPVIIVACGDHRISWKRSDGKDHCDIDVAIAVDHMSLAAVAEGLGSCWVCAFDAKKLHGLLELPEYIEPIVLLPLGYPKAERTSHTNRKSMEELISWK